MNPQSFGPIALKLLLLLVIGMLLCSCNAHQQEREFQNYLCECDADGGNFKLLCRNNYSSSMSGFFQLYLHSYPFRIEHGKGDDLFAFRDDGIYLYNHQNQSWQDYLRGMDFKYRATNYFHSPAQAYEYYFKADTKLFKTLQDGSQEQQLYRNVRSCVGIPHQPQFCILDNSGSLRVENSGIIQPTAILPPTTTQAYYFAELKKIVYLSLDSFFRCDSDGSNIELLYAASPSVNSQRSFYPINEAGVFVTNNIFGYIDKLLLIDATDGSVQDIGKIRFSQSPDKQYLPFQISRAHNGSKLLFFDSTALYFYDLTSMQTEPVLISSQENYHLRNITSASISSDGSKINFFCEVYRYK
ncbi:MAG: hypothetical protein LHW64_01835 [Candidatus Cloacimonetes bacterium]|jgi:hypothetical protein|nr:hypothetical protein [Candidatus Cloacimonadota bacterium]MCK9583778.1 hypothetical protein [Candidatus Cloacimonadota bacterium]MDY0228849.1 hypothetical protein [Candidatus Cloacimonadaceae bacterium]